MRMHACMYYRYDRNIPVIRLNSGILNSFIIELLFNLDSESVNSCRSRRPHTVLTVYNTELYNESICISI